MSTGCIASVNACCVVCVCVLTLPQEEIGLVETCPASSAACCSASPHEQFLHAFFIGAPAPAGPHSLADLTGTTTGSAARSSSSPTRSDSRSFVSSAARFHTSMEHKERDKMVKCL